jgi:hypothetical protein
MPLAGTFRTPGGIRTLFVCLVGHTTATNVWAYAALTTEEQERLRMAVWDSTEDMIAELESMLLGRRITMALAVDGEVCADIRLRIGNEMGLWMTVRDFLHAAVRDIRDAGAQLAPQELPASRAEVEQAVRELVFA